MDWFAAWLIVTQVSVATSLVVLSALGAISGLRRWVVSKGSAVTSVAGAPFWCGVLIAGSSFVVNVAVAAKQGIPEPKVHDEFSYLLAADTFASGRLTNPTPPMPEHFEAPHILVRPTYASKYPPGQGVALAAGQWLTGLPVVGVWLSTAAACAAVYWMLLAFVGRRWALVGGAATSIHPQLLAWSQVYWGGSVAVLGAALFVGAWGRLLARWSIGPSLVLGAGLVVLANSRPFEGLVLSCPLLAVLVVRTLRARATTFRAVVPLFAVLATALAAMGYYNFAVTGRAWEMPYTEHVRQYDVYPMLWFMPPHAEPIYASRWLREVHVVWSRQDYLKLRTLRGFFEVSGQRLWRLFESDTRPLVLLPGLVAGIFLWRDGRRGTLIAALMLMIAAVLCETWYQPHYAAPLVPVVFLLTVAGLEKIWRTSGKAGGLARSLVVSVVAGYVAGVSLFLITQRSVPAHRTGRADIVSAYPQMRSGRQLVFVRYLPGHLPDDEWVYNGANLALQQIVWAQDRGTDSDERLLEAFPGRSAWLLRVGSVLRLDRYAGPTTRP